MGSGGRHDMSHGFHRARTSDHVDYTSNTRSENSNLAQLGVKVVVLR